MNEKKLDLLIQKCFSKQKHKKIYNLDKKSKNIENELANLLLMKIKQ